MRRLELKHNWLEEVFEAKTSGLESVDNQLKEIESLIRLIENQPLESPICQQFVETVSHLFSGSGFLYVYPKENSHVVVFGFEYSPESFDWYGYLRGLVDKEPVEVKGRLVHSIASDQLDFFIDGNVLYGIVGGDSIDVADLIASIQFP